MQRWWDDGCLTDVVDVCVDGAERDWPPGRVEAAARHALVFSDAWRSRFGTIPSADMHSAYCSGEAPSGPLDRVRFERFAASVMQCAGRRPDQAALDKYESSLEDPDALAEAVTLKLESRYGVAAPRGVPMNERVAAMRAAAPPGIRLSNNPATGNNLEYPGCRSAVSPDPPLAEAWRIVMERDLLLTSRAARGACLFVDSSAASYLDAAVALAGEMHSVFGGPIAVASDCPRTLARLSEEWGTYHYSLSLHCREAYDAAPRLFRAFVLFGGAASARPPLCLDRGRCWHYAIGGVDPDDLGPGYSVVADSPEGLAVAQRAAGRLAYVVPMMHERSERLVGVGVHPDSAHLVTCANRLAVVPPEMAHTCGTYVSCVSEEGAIACMASGGVAVARDLRMIDDGVNGFLSLSSDADAVDSAVARALGCCAADIGAEAARVRLVHGRAAFSRLWRGILSRPDPVVSRSPADAATLSERFLAVSCVIRYRELSRLRGYCCGSERRRAVLFADSRPCAVTAMSVLLTLANLKPGWGVVGMVSGASEPFFRDVLGHTGAVLEKPPELSKNGFTIELYNSMMKSTAFWLRVADLADDVLCVQSDGYVVRRGLESHPCMSSEYCGAPWLHHPYLSAATAGNMVGNGGLSFRCVMAMIDACRKGAGAASRAYPLAPLMSEPEDVFFSSRVKACPYVDARTFSMEQDCSPDALGVHQFWVYHPVDFTASFLERVLRETAETVPSTSLSRRSAGVP